MRTGRPSVVWNGGVSSYVSRAPVVAAGKLAPSMLSTRFRSFRNWAGASVGIFEKSWMDVGRVGSTSAGSRGGCDTGSSSVARQTTTRRMPVIDLAGRRHRRVAPRQENFGTTLCYKKIGRGFRNDRDRRMRIAAFAACNNDSEKEQRRKFSHRRGILTDGKPHVRNHRIRRHA